jgi:REP element-mobilizing transposase RayT
MAKKFENTYRVPTARLRNWDYRSNAFYFVTICTKNNRHWFGRVSNSGKPEMQLSDIGKIANARWLEIPEHFPFIELGEHIIMPNHIHGILSINRAVQTPYQGVSNEKQLPHTSNQTDLLIPNKPEGHFNQTSQSETPANMLSYIPDAALTLAPGGKTKEWNSGSLAVIINQYKRACTIEARRLDKNFGWHPRFHDHIIRNEKSFQIISDYIVNNPAKWGSDRYY